MRFYLPEILGGPGDMEPNPPATAWTTLCALSCRALAVTVQALSSDDSGKGKLLQAKGAAAGEPGEAVAALSGLLQDGAAAHCVTAVDAVQRRRFRAASRRLWTGADGFTLAGPRAN